MWGVGWGLGVWRGSAVIGIYVYVCRWRYSRRFIGMCEMWGLCMYVVYAWCLGVCLGRFTGVD